MTVSMNIEFIMIPTHLGGRNYPFAENSFSHIRWQHYLYQDTHSVRSIRFIKLEYEPSTRLGYANCIFPFDDPFPETWLKIGELIELLEGARVVAIGKIVESRDRT